MPVTHYKQLIVWQRAIELVARIYTLTSKFPKEEIYTLTAQLHRAAISIPSNIAEGHGRLSKGGYRHFLGIARGSLHEVDTQIHIAEKLGYVSRGDWLAIGDDIVQISKMLNAIVASLEKKTAYQ